MVYEKHSFRRPQNFDFPLTGEKELVPPPLRAGIKLNSYLFFSEILNSFLEKLIPTYFSLKSLIPTNCLRKRVNSYPNVNSSQTQDPKIFRLWRAISHCKILFTASQIVNFFRLRRAFPLQKLCLDPRPNPTHLTTHLDRFDQIRASYNPSGPSFDPVRSYYYKIYFTRGSARRRREMLTICGLIKRFYNGK